MNISLQTLIPLLHAQCDTATDVSISAVSIDTRTLTAGSLYVAIVGDVHDGHDFIDQAVTKGAIAVVADRPVKTTVPVLVVANTREALGRIAAHWRAQFDIPVIGITGSNGKTTVKEICRAILDQCGKTLATEKNNNNDIGVPLTLLQLDSDTQYAVIEMGTNHQGEIAWLAELVRPTVAAITTIGESHLAAFVTREAVAEEKAAIYAFQDKTDRAVLPADCAQASILLNRVVADNVLRFGRGADSDVQVKRITTEQVQIEDRQDGISLQCGFALLGEHNLQNLACAIAIVGGLGLDVNKIKAGIDSCTAVKGRLNPQRISEHLLVIDDSYNANPSSVREAINVLAEMAGVRILVFGDMGELGAAAAEYHREIGEYASSKAIDLLLTTGELAQLASEAFSGNKRHFETATEIAEFILELEGGDNIVLVKASRFMGLDKVVHQIKEQAA